MKNCETVDVEETKSSTPSPSPSPSQTQSPLITPMILNPGQSRETETQLQPPPPQHKDKEEEQEEHRNSNNPETPPLSSIKSYSPLLFQSPSPLSNDSPFSDSSSSQTYHTHEYRVTPSDTNPESSPLAPAQTFRAEPKFVGPTTPQQDGGFGHGGPSVVQEESGGVKMRTLRPKLSILKRSRRESMVRRALFGFRVSGFVLCLISFSVMAADKNKGWALDSFHRYKELRYCLAVNVIGFVYSGLQTYDLTYYFTNGKHIMQHHFHRCFDFLMDQILTYLLMSASSSAAIRVDDWESNWGKDKFPDMARASVALSFLAFFTFASSSLISGYTLCTLKTI